MRLSNLIVLAVVGFLAQLVDGALGMAYGVTSTTLLLTVGIAPAAASASVHLSEVVTTAVSGASHWRFGNVDWGKVVPLAVPGFFGAFGGALALSFLPEDLGKTVMAVFLFALGVYILIKFAFRAERPINERPIARVFLAPLGLFAGFMDALGGGGWGPIATPTLLSSGRMQPRKVVGTVDTSEFVVALGASIGFLLALGSQGVLFGVVGALIAGGVVAAPIAAWIVRHLNARVLGTAVGGVILLTNARIFLNAVGFEGIAVPTFALLTIVWLGALALAIAALRRERQPVLVEEA
jgi:uncharacterized membrane protein YfcA